MHNWYFNCSTKLNFCRWQSYLQEIKTTSNILLISTKGFQKRGLIQEFINILGKNNNIIIKMAEENPEISKLNELIEELKGASIEYIIALGGGSVIDTAKVLSIFIQQECKINIYDNLINKAKINNNNPIKIIAIPTTAGSGSEVTQFATVWDKERLEKHSISSDSLRPKVSILDYKLTIGLPIDITISSGLDALSHGFESIWNKNANPITILLAKNAIKIALDQLPELAKDPSNEKARELMQQSSCMSGMAISNTKTALAHSMSYPLTTKFDLPHGIACSFTLGELLIFNSQLDDGRLLQLANELGFGSVEKLSSHIYNLLIELNIRRRLKEFLPSDQREILSLSSQMSHPERALNNIRKAHTKDIEFLIKNSLNKIDFN